MTDSYIAIDIETTGLAPGKDKITEIAALRVEEGKIMGRFATLVNPGCPLSETVIRLTGITDEMVSGAPPVKDVIGELKEFCQGLPLLGHNISFDYAFLKQAAAESGLDFEAEAVDTLGLCRRFMPEGQSRNLESACAYYGVKQEGAHRAMADALSAHFLYQKLCLGHGRENQDAFGPKPLIYQVKKAQPATKRQKEYLQDLIKYHRINITVQMDSLTRSEASRTIDRIISQYGRMAKIKEVNVQ